MTGNAEKSRVGLAEGASQHSSVDRIEELGIVGAGGGGFPAAAKFRTKVSLVIANAAECEPLLHKDKELLHHCSEPFLRGMKIAMELVGAPEGVIGIKEKYHDIIEALEQQAPQGVRVVPLPDCYPAGDEFILVHLVTGRVIPPGGLPKDVDTVVSNVETLINMGLDQPVTHKYLTVAGAVENPCTLRVPVGISIREVIEAAGGATVSDIGVFISGIMMGTLTFDADDAITKTTGGLIVLPRDHYLMTRRTRSQAEMNHIGKSACDQCSYCTEFCPRYLLGYEVQPHKVMRSLGFTSTGADIWNQWSELCCACGLCTLYACPEDLYPKEACDDGKRDRRAAGLKFIQQKPVAVHPMKEYRRVPLSQLRRRLQVEGYERETPYDPATCQPAMVRIRMKQHAGEPAVPVVP